MNEWEVGQPGTTDKWGCVQSCYYDDNGVLWILDPAAPMSKTIQGNRAKLVKMNKSTGGIERNYNLMNILTDTSYANDVRINVARGFAYMTESKGGGILVVNLSDGMMRRYWTILDPVAK